MAATLRLWTALLLAVCGGCQDTAVAARGDDATLARFKPLVPFYQALAAVEAGRASQAAVLQIGDSHTANDAFSGRLRELMQARFGRWWPRPAATRHPLQLLSPR